MIDIIEIKQRFAKENIELLERNSIDLSGKKVLDVGFGLGYNSKAMNDHGATVYGVEPDENDFKYAISNGFIDAKNAFNCSLQDIPKELLETFDVAVVFLYCISLEEREEFSQTLAKVIKPNGVVVIEIVDDVFIKGDIGIEPVSFSIFRYFNSAYLTKRNYGLIIVAKDPSILKKKDLAFNI